LSRNGPQGTRQCQAAVLEKETPHGRMSNTIKEITYIHFKQGINLLLKDWESFEELFKNRKRNKSYTDGVLDQTNLLETI